MATCSEPVVCAGCNCVLENNANCDTETVSPHFGPVMVELSSFSRTRSCGSDGDVNCQGAILAGRGDTYTTSTSQCGTNRVECSEYDGAYILEQTQELNGSPTTWVGGPFKIARNHYILLTLTRQSLTTTLPYFSLSVVFTSPIGFYDRPEANDQCVILDFDDYNNLQDEDYCSSFNFTNLCCGASSGITFRSSYVENILPEQNDVLHMTVLPNSVGQFGSVEYWVNSVVSNRINNNPRTQTPPFVPQGLGTPQTLFFGHPFLSVCKPPTSATITFL